MSESYSDSYSDNFSDPTPPDPIIQTKGSHKGRSSLPSIKIKSFKFLRKSKDKKKEEEKEKKMPQKKMLVLDLDETLIHTTTIKPTNPELDYITLKFDDEILYAIKRPFVREFLEIASELFELAIFTAGEREYADQILDDICPNSKTILPKNKRKYRDSCKLHFQKLYKDLDIFGKSKKDILIVDDNPENTYFFPKNAIVIPAFLGDENDTFLLDKLLPVLQKCSTSKDVRSVINSRKVRRLV